MKTPPRRFFIKAKLATSENPESDQILSAPYLPHSLTKQKWQAPIESLKDSVINTPRPHPLRGILFFSLGFILLSTIFTLGYFSFKDSRKKISLTPSTRQSADIVMGLRDGSTGLHYDLKLADARPDIIASFLARYKSPLKPYDHYGKVLVATADRYNLDYRLLPAIMMQESNLCKTSDPAIHNCLGFGIHKRGTLAFDSYDESFDRAARELKERYIDIGLTTPEEIMTKYTPSSNGSWANSVNQWIAEMEHNSREQGIASTTDADLTVYSQP